MVGLCYSYCKEVCICWCNRSITTCSWGEIIQCNATGYKKLDKMHKRTFQRQNWWSTIEDSGRTTSATIYVMQKIWFKQHIRYDSSVKCWTIRVGHVNFFISFISFISVRVCVCVCVRVCVCVCVRASREGWRSILGFSCLAKVDGIIYPRWRP